MTRKIRVGVSKTGLPPSSEAIDPEASKSLPSMSNLPAVIRLER